MAGDGRALWSRADEVGDSKPIDAAYAQLRVAGRGVVAAHRAGAGRVEGGDHANASEIAPIVAEAYQLSTREQQITELIARGVATAEIADRLFLSVHTVRDYVKAIFERIDA